MGDFEKWFEDQDFYTNMRFIHGDRLFDKDGEVYRVLPVQIAYQGWNARQSEIDELKAQLECCRKENAVLLGKVGELQERLKAVYALSRMRASVISSWKREELSIKVRKAISYLAKKEKASRGEHEKI